MRIAMHVRITITETGKRLIAENKMTIKEKLLRTIKSDIALALKKVGIDEVSPSCEIPPSYELGNLAFPMFKYSSILKDKPFNIASKIQKELSGNSLIKKSEVKGAYLNIFYDIKRVAVELLPDILRRKKISENLIIKTGKSYWSSAVRIQTSLCISGTAGITAWAIP